MRVRPSMVHNSSQDRSQNPSGEPSISDLDFIHVKGRDHALARALGWASGGWVSNAPEHKAQIKPWRAGCVSFALGALLVLSHAPFFIWIAFILGMALFFPHLDAALSTPKPARAGFWRGWMFGFGYFLAGLYWIGAAFIARGPDFIPVMVPAIILLCAGIALFWGLAGWGYVKLRPKGLHKLFVFIGVFSLAEFTRGHILTGFPWNLPAYIFKAGGPFSQLAAYIDIYTFSFLVIALGASLGWGLFFLVPKRVRFSPISISLAGLVSVYALGSLRLSNAEIDFVDGVNLRVLQTNVSQADKLDGRNYVPIVQDLLSQSYEGGLNGVTHIIWPESAVPGLMLEDAQLIQALDQTLSNGPVLLTNLGRVIRPEDPKLLDDFQNWEIYNSFTALDFKGDGPVKISRFYDKNKLVPFGEFIPFSGLFEKLGLGVISSAIGSMTAGTDKSVRQLPGLPPVSVQICYEISFPGFMLRAGSSSEKALRAQWILNVSNDSWYGKSTGPFQHINQARYRAIEEGVPVVRSAASGISAVIDPYGRYVSAGKFGDKAVINQKLPIALEKNGNIRHLGALLILLILLYVIVLKYLWFMRWKGVSKPKEH